MATSGLGRWPPASISTSAPRTGRPCGTDYWPSLADQCLAARRLPGDWWRDLRCEPQLLCGLDSQPVVLRHVGVWADKSAVRGVAGGVDSVVEPKMFSVALGQR